MFHILEREMQWRREQGLNEGFEALRAYKPVVAVGAEDPLEAQKMLADYFRMYLYGIFGTFFLVNANNFRRTGWTWWNPC